MDTSHEFSLWFSAAPRGQFDCGSVADLACKVTSTAVFANLASHRCLPGSGGDPSARALKAPLCTMSRGAVFLFFSALWETGGAHIPEAV